MSNNRTLKVAAAISISFTGFAVIIIFLSAKRIITFQMALLMLVALVGLYLGFGILIALYRFVARLE